MGKPTVLLVLLMVAVLGVVFYFGGRLITSKVQSPQATVNAVTEAPAPVVVAPAVVPSPTTEPKKQAAVKFAPVTIPVKPVVRKTVKKGFSVEETAYAQGELNHFKAVCLRDVVDYKIDGDIQNGYRDFGNVLDFYHRDPKPFLQSASLNPCPLHNHQQQDE